jgi:calcineurin-like phosphoesterase family protein
LIYTSFVRWIVGDIHGMLRPLEGLIDAVNQLDSSPQWMFVGDYVNRGPDARGVLELLLKIPSARFCRGNHDDILDLILSGESYAEQSGRINREVAFRWFMEHGLADTLASYGISGSQIAKALERPTEAELDFLISPIPQAHRDFLRGLEPVIQEPDLFVAHAKWDVQRSDTEPSLMESMETDHELRRIAIWGRFTYEELDQPKAWQRTGYFGHTPVDNYGARGGYDRHGGGKLVPIVGEKLVLVDTASALSPVGLLTAYCPDAPQFIQANRRGNII